MDKYIPNSVPVVSGNEKKYVNNAIQTGWIATGTYIKNFEDYVAKYCKVKNAVATSSGTAALHISLLLAGIKNGDAILLPNLTFAASANAIKYCNAIPIFIDVSLDDWCICPNELKKFIEKKCIKKNGNLFLKNTNTKVAAIMPVHLYGHLAKLKLLKKICKEYKLVLVEDGAEALGAIQSNKSIGEGSSLCSLSFNGNKIITSGAGGMILTNSNKLARKARYLIAQSKNHLKEFIHDEVGYNYRMANINAAFALGQAEKLDYFVSRKRDINNNYFNLLKDYKYLNIKTELKENRSSFWMVILTLDEKIFKTGAKELRDYLEKNLIEARPIWQPLYRQKAFKNALNFSHKNSEKLYKYSLCLPCSVNLDKETIIKICTKIIEYCEKYIKE